MDSIWAERGLIFGGWAIAVVLALSAVVGVFRPDGDHETSRTPLVAARPSPVRTPASSVLGAAQSPEPARSQASPVPATTAPAPTPAPSLNRCDELRSSRNWTPGDREWFLSACLGGGGTRPTAPSSPPVDDGGPVASAPSTPAPVAPTPVPTAPGVDGAQAAIALAVRWLSTEASIAYTADAGSCSAQSLAGTWTVTCRAMLAGCSEAIACQRTIRLHVSLNPPSVGLAS